VIRTAPSTATWTSLDGSGATAFPDFPATAIARDSNGDLYVANDLKTGRVMVKDEDVCLHCGLCAERCPTGAWDMRKYYIEMTHAEPACRKQ